MDRDRRVLVDNQPSFDIVFIPTRRRISGRSSIRSRSSIRTIPRPPRPFGPPGPRETFVPVLLERNIGMEKLAVVETHALELPVW